MTARALYGVWLAEVMAPLMALVEHTLHVDKKSRYVIGLDVAIQGFCPRDWTLYEDQEVSDGHDT